MRSRLGQLAPQRIFVLRALQLGDMLCAVPALRALRAAAPAAKITLCGLPWAEAFVSRFGAYLDEFVEFPGYPGLPERPVGPRQVVRFLECMQDEVFDLAIQLHGSGSFVNSLVMLCQPRQAAGFFVPGEYCPDEGWFMPYPEQGSEIERLGRLLEFLGASVESFDLEFPLTPKDWGELAQVREAQSLMPRHYVCIHPGGRALSRRWHVGKFAAVADSLARKGLRVVITGTVDEQDVACAVTAAMSQPATNLAGQTTLGAAAALVSGARLVVTNDTGMSHIAAALRVPSVVVVLGSDPERWAPLDRGRHRPVMADMDCRPCGHFECPIGFGCATALEVEPVLARCDELLELSF